MPILLLPERLPAQHLVAAATAPQHVEQPHRVVPGFSPALLKTGCRFSRHQGIRYFRSGYGLGGELEEDRGRRGRTRAGTHPDPGYWDRRAPSFARSTQARADEFLKVIDPYVSPVKTLIDAGAGTGRHAVPLAERLEWVTAVEPSEGMRSMIPPRDEHDRRRQHLGGRRGRARRPGDLQPRPLWRFGHRAVHRQAGAMRARARLHHAARERPSPPGGRDSPAPRGR